MGNDIIIRAWWDLRQDRFNLWTHFYSGIVSSRSLAYGSQRRKPLEREYRSRYA